MQQQSADYDLLAVFPDESQADAAATKLHKEGFTDAEVHQIAHGLVGAGEFRVHGPNQDRSTYFLQTRRSGPAPTLLAVLALVFAVILGGLSFAASFAFPKVLLEPGTVIVGILIGGIIGVLLAFLRGGRVRGDIGQKAAGKKASPAPSVMQGERTVVALRFSDPDNISRNSRARAILINNQGKIDRSVGRKQ